MVQNNKWRKKYKGGKIKRMNKMYQSLKEKYDKKQSQEEMEGGSSSGFEDIE
jgi:hypothetical protein